MYWSRLGGLAVLLLVLATALVGWLPASAQGPQPEQLRVEDLDGLMPGGVRISATESWGALEFTLKNFTAHDIKARVVISYKGEPDVEYGRDVWVPARAMISTWMLVGPAPAQEAETHREISYKLFQEVEGKYRRIRRRGDLATSGRWVPYDKRAPFTAVLLDDEMPEQDIFGQLPQPPSRSQEAFFLVHGFRFAKKLTGPVHILYPGPLPPSAEALDGMDHFVLASDRLAHDAAGMRALRRWLQRGGKVWVMLDMVTDPAAFASLLGDALDFEVVDRVSLTRFKIEAQVADQGVTGTPEQKHERPVEFVRVLLPPQEKVQHTVNGWPAWFTRQVGRGKVVFTTLGPRAWYRIVDPAVVLNASVAGLLGAPNGQGPLLVATAFYPGRTTNLFLPIPTEPLQAMAAELQPPPEEESFVVEEFKPGLAAEIGYAVASRVTVGLIFGGFLLAALALGLILRKFHRPELLGWLGPVVAAGAALVFFALGESTRHAVPPTIAISQIVDAGTGTGEVPIHGELGVYRPNPGAAEMGVEHGGLFDLDMSGLKGKTRQLILTDMDAWKWDNLELPVSVRFAKFHYTAPTPQPITAVAHFGPQGLEGKLGPGPFKNIGDALVSVPGGRQLAVRLRPDGTFQAGRDDILPTGQFLANTVLNDRQQRRQELYRKFLKPPAPSRLKGRTVLFAWADPIDMHFQLVPDAKKVGDALLVIPLRLEDTAPGTQVTVPGPFLACRRLLDNRLAAPTLSSTLAVDMHLRFQLPPEVLPLRVSEAKLRIKINAPSREVTIAGFEDGKRRPPLKKVGSPLDAIEVPLHEPFLQVDDKGGLHVNLAVSEPLKRSANDEAWTIEYLEMEVTGKIFDKSRLQKRGQTP